MRSRRAAPGFVLLFVIAMLAVLTISMAVLSRAMHSRMGTSRQLHAREAALRSAEGAFEKARMKLKNGIVNLQNPISGGVPVRWSIDKSDNVTFEAVVAFDPPRSPALPASSALVRALRLKWTLAPSKGTNHLPFEGMVLVKWQADDLSLKPGDPLLAR